MQNDHRDYIRAVLPLILQISEEDERLLPLFDSRVVKAIAILREIKTFGAVAEIDLRRKLGLSQSALDDYLSVFFVDSVLGRDAQKMLFLLDVF